MRNIASILIVLSLASVLRADDDARAIMLMLMRIALANPSKQAEQPVTESKPSICITLADFPCAPCEALKRYDWSAFNVEWKIGGADSYPQITWYENGERWGVKGLYTPEQILKYVRPVKASQAPTPIDEVRRILALLKPTRAETFIDYGCGDGRWLIEAVRSYRCKAIGIEIDPAQVERARVAVKDAGLDNLIRIIEGDVTTVDVQADVGVVYLYPDTLTRLKPRLTQLNRFASYMHRVDGLVMHQDGDVWLWERQPEQRHAVWGGSVYSGPVCSNPGCVMCQSIRQQLGQRTR
jgi:SAM-dependent methyltransferase